MPAKSKVQRKFFGIVRSIKSGEIAKSYSTKAAKVAKTMKLKAIRHFAKTKEKGLPMRKKKSNPGVGNSSNATEIYPSLPVVVGKIKERQKKRRKIMEELFPEESIKSR